MSARGAARARISAALAVGALTAGLAGGALAIAAAQPREQVVVAARAVQAGQRLTARDLRLASVPSGGEAARQLEPASLAGLIPGQYLTTTVIAGQPILVADIHPGRVHVSAAAGPRGLSCPGG